MVGDGPTTGCRSCQLLRINGVVTHEHGCQDAWRYYMRECNWCGQDFTPEYKAQDCCDDNCSAAYHG